MIEKKIEIREYVDGNGNVTQYRKYKDDEGYDVIIGKDGSESRLVGFPLSALKPIKVFPNGNGGANQKAKG